MKVRTRLLMGGLAVLVAISVIIFSCRKNADKVEEAVAGVTASGKQLAQMQVSWDVRKTNTRANPCEGGEVTFITLEWDMATCRSNCTRGIGFRCGRRVTFGCRNGPTEIITYYGSCPNGASSYTRSMKANLSFYSSGSAKLIFLNAVPADEAGNVNFEIEADEVLSLPEGLLLDGVSYSGFKTAIGTYKIDYSDGMYGSVTIPVLLIQRK
jgi:hypothetical protein